MAIDVPDLRHDAEGNEKPNFLGFNDNASQVLKLLPVESKRRFDVQRAALEDCREKTSDPELWNQAKVIVYAIGAEQCQRQLASTQDRSQAELLKNGLINYNHMLSTFIYDNPGGVYMDDIVSWLTEATGNADWAKTTVLGAGGEVALRRLLESDPRVDVYPGTLEQDRKGIDLIARVDNPNGKVYHYGIDVKVRQASHKYYDYLDHRGTAVVDDERLRLVEWNLRDEDLESDFTIKDGASQTQLRELIYTTKMPINR